MIQIALFGTSADPPTVGHRAIIEWLAPRFDKVAVWAADNPFKGGQTPLAHRQTMLALLLDTVRQTHAHVCLCPDLSDGRSLNSVRLAQRVWPQGRLTLVVGSDVLESLPHWYRIDVLLREVHLQIVPRPSFPVRQQDLDALKDLGGQLSVAADFVGPDVSSTAHRQAKAEEDMIPAIAAYIREHELYAWAKHGGA